MVQENCFLISHHYNCIAALYCGDSPFQADRRTERGMDAMVDNIALKGCISCDRHGSLQC